MLPCFLLSNFSFSINRNLFWWGGGGKDQFRFYSVVLLLLFLVQSSDFRQCGAQTPVNKLFLQWPLSGDLAVSLFSSSKVTLPWGDLSDLAIINITGGLAESSRSNCFLAQFLFYSSRDMILAQRG